MLIQVRVTQHAGGVMQYLVEFSEFRAFLDYIRSSFISFRYCSLEKDRLPDLSEHLVRKLDQYENLLPDCDVFVLLSMGENYAWHVHIYEKSVLMETFANAPTHANLRHVFKYDLDDSFGQKYRVSYKIHGSTTRLSTVPGHIEFILLCREELRSQSSVEKTTIRKAEYAKRVKSV